MTTRKELTEALRARYRSATFGDRIKILDEIVALMGYHCKHIIRALGEKAVDARTIPVRNCFYDEILRQHTQGLLHACNALQPLQAHGSVLPAMKEKLQTQFEGLDPVRLLQEIRLAQNTLSELAAHGVCKPQAPADGEDVTAFMAS